MLLLLLPQLLPSSQHASVLPAVFYVPALLLLMVYQWKGTEENVQKHLIKFQIFKKDIQSSSNELQKPLKWCVKIAQIDPNFVALYL